MKKIFLIILLLGCGLTIYSQSELAIKPIPALSNEWKYSDFIYPKLPVNDSLSLIARPLTDLEINYLYPLASKHKLLSGYYGKAFSFQLKQAEVSTFSEGVVHPGIGNVENYGLTFKRQLTPKLSVEGVASLNRLGNFWTMERHISPTIGARVDYSITPKFNIYAWTQQVFNPNKATLLYYYMNELPISNTGMGLEFKPSKDVKIGIRGGFQKNIHRRGGYKSFVEGFNSFMF